MMYSLKDLLPDDISSSEDYEIMDTDHVQDEHIDLLDKCKTDWDNLIDVREEYIRNRNFYAGDQWSDLVTDPTNSTKKITERQLILDQGRQPIVNNQIQKIVRNLLGQFRDNDYKPLVISRKKEEASTTEMMTNGLQYVYDAEEISEMDVREFESFLLKGIPGFKVYWGWNNRRQEYGINIDRLNVHRMFFNTDIEDIRMRDLRRIGEVHDMLPEDVITTFSKGDPEKKNIIKRWLGNPRENYGYQNIFNSTNLDNMDFYTPEDYDKVRVFEIWYKKKKLQALCHDYGSGETFIHQLDPEEAETAIMIENQSRIELAASQGMPIDQVPFIEMKMEEIDVWHYCYLTAQGHCLAQGETPYEHNEHPYLMRPYPMTDRIILPFVSTVIDQQKYVNRLITMMDFMLGAGAKGVLMVPESVIPSGSSPEKFAEDWVKFNGVIVYKPDRENPGAVPQQIYTNSQSVAGEKMLALQLQLLKEISGVNDAIQGQKISGVNTASQYAQMSNNASMSSKDYFEHYANLRKHRDLKVVRLMQQYWDKKRYIAVSGDDYMNEAYEYDPELAKWGEYDVVIGKSGNSPVYRAQMDEYLMEFLRGQMIDLDLFLEHTSLPFAQKLKQSIAERKELQMDQIREMANSPEAQQAMQVDPQTQQLFNQALQVN